MLTARRVDRPAPDPYRGLAFVQPSAAYDLIVSLRALYNPRTYTRTKAWAAATAALLPASANERGRFFFQGFDTALGYGAAQLIPDLGSAPTPEALIRAVRRADPRTIGLRMLDTGETSATSLAVLGRTLEGRAKPREITSALAGSPPEWARRCRRVLADPARARDELAALLETYHAKVFAEHIPAIQTALTASARAASRLLEMLPTADAIEQLAGGYTLADDLRLERITLAPSVFIYPFMATRVDEARRAALVVYGIPSALFADAEPDPADSALLASLRALAHPARLRIVRLLAARPMYGRELVTAVGLKQPTVHHHLAQLRTARLVRQERSKGGMRYSIRDDSARAHIATLDELISGRARSDRQREPGERG